MHLPDIIVPIENPNGDFAIFNIASEKANWPELRDLWATYNVTLPFCFVPPETKLDLFFYYACRQYGVPASLGSVYNPSLADHLLSKVAHDCLVISSNLTRYLLSNELFAENFDRLLLLVSVGDLDSTIEQQLSERYPHIAIAILPHPIEMLSA